MLHPDTKKHPKNNAKTLKKLHSSMRGAVAKKLSNLKNAAPRPAAANLSTTPEMRTIGRAVILAHGAGGSSSHASCRQHAMNITASEPTHAPSCVNDQGPTCDFHRHISRELWLCLACVAFVTFLWVPAAIGRQAAIYKKRV